MQTVRNMGIFFLIASLLFSACDIEKNDNTEIDTESLASGLTLEMKQLFSGETPLAFKLATVEKFDENENYHLQLDWTFTDNSLFINVEGRAEKRPLDFSGYDNAYTTFELPILDNGTYPITITTPFDETKFELEVNDTHCTLTTLQTGDVVATNAIMQKLPQDAIWGNVFFNAIDENRQLAQQFIDSLVSIGAVYAAFEAGNYGNLFSIDENEKVATQNLVSWGISPNGTEDLSDSKEVARVPFAFSYTGDVSTINQIADVFKDKSRNEHQSDFFIIGTNSDGTQFGSNR